MRTRSSTAVTAWPALSGCWPAGAKSTLSSAKLLARFLGQDQVADVRRIEAAAQEAHPQRAGLAAASR